MSDASPGAMQHTLRSAWADMDRQGYALTTDADLDLPPKFRENFRQTYFNEHSLQHDVGDLPRDRRRARDVVVYEWSGDDPVLEEYETIAITDRANIKGTRIHKRIKVLADSEAKDLIIRLLHMIPPTARRRQGTFGINFFRTYTDVVTKPHMDNEEYIFLYVLHRDGDGAQTYLYRAGSDGDHNPEPDDLILERQLNPGDIILFRDDQFLHGAKPLVNPPNGQAMRDVLVCTVDYDTTYLKPLPVA